MARNDRAFWPEAMRTNITRLLQSIFLTIALAIAACAALSQSQQPPSPLITQISAAPAGKNIIIRVTGNGLPAPHTMRLTNPERIVLDFQGAHLALAHATVPAASSPIRRVRTGQFKPDVARVVIDLEHAVAYSLQPQPDGFAVEFDTASAAAPISPRRATPASAVNASATQSVTDGKSAPSLQGQVTPFENSLNDGMLTFRAQQLSLRSVLQQIGSLAGIPIQLGDIPGNEPISVEFHHYRLDEALRQILKSYDFLFLYGDDASSLDPGPLLAVWVYSAGRGEDLRDATKSAITTAAQFGSPPANLPFTGGASTAAAPQGNVSLAGVLQALKDPNDVARLQALSRALNANMQIPQDILVNMSLTDASGQVRLMALRALPINPDLKWVFERAAEDASQPVADAAQGILRGMDVRERAKLWGGRGPRSPQP